jgi:hypothetical protein
VRQAAAAVAAVGQRPGTALGVCVVVGPFRRIASCRDVDNHSERGCATCNSVVDID